MKLGPLPRGLAVAAMAAVTVVPFAASAAGAAPAAPTAYAAFGSAQPLFWRSPSTVGEIHAPSVVGRSNNTPAPVASATASLASPDEHPITLSGEAIAGLSCVGYAEKCRDPFAPIAKADHSGPKAAHSEQSAAFAGREGKFPGSIKALTDCAGNCGDQFIRSAGEATGPAGALTGYVSIGSSLARQDLTVDDKGRLVSNVTSELKNVSIGPKNEVHFSSLITTAQAIGSGAENTKDGRADLRITDFFILDTRVELTRAGLRLANAGPSEQEAYDGAKVLLTKLRDRGIRLELPNFDAQLAKTPAHVAAETQGLRVYFEQNVGSVQASALPYPLELGHATAVVAALDADRNINIDENPNGGVVVNTTAPAPAPAPNQGDKPKPGVNPPVTNRNAGGPKSTNPPTSGTVKDNVPSSSPDVVNATPSAPNGDSVTSPPADIGSPGEITDSTPPPGNPDDVALGLRDVERKLGLRGAHSVSRAFGAFLGLGLILPLARFVIRRLG